MSCKISSMNVVFFAGSMTILHPISVDAEAAGDLPHDACTMDQHCMNAGTCESANEDVDHKHCVCQLGYSGPRCSRYCPLECENNGYCTVKPKGGALGVQEQTPTYDPADYMCKCFGHFTGDRCETPYSNCGGQIRCYHGGECRLESDPDYSASQPCRCPIGYSGQSCENRSSVDWTQEEDELNLSTTGIFAITFSAIIVVSVMLLVAIKRWPPNNQEKGRTKRKSVEFQRFVEEPEDEGEDDTIVEGIQRFNQEYSQAKTILQRPSQEHIYTNRGLELNVLQP